MFCFWSINCPLWLFLLRCNILHLSILFSLVIHQIYFAAICSYDTVFCCITVYLWLLMSPIIPQTKYVIFFLWIISFQKKCEFSFQNPPVARFLSPKILCNISTTLYYLVRVFIIFIISYFYHNIIKNISFKSNWKINLSIESKAQKLWQNWNSVNSLKATILQLFFWGGGGGRIASTS